MAETSFKAGLEDVVANQSDICFIDGKEGRLVYRGYDIVDLAAHSPYEEVAFLLWEGRLPNRAELTALTEELASNRALQGPVLDLLRRMPKDTDPMDVLRTAVSFLGIYDTTAKDMSRAANRRRAVQLTAQIPSIVATFDRLRQGRDPVAPDTALSHAENFLYMLHGSRPSPLYAHVFNVALVLHADHELNASTFAARVTAGTLSDLYSAITSAVGTLKGPLHGGANEQVMHMLMEIGSVDRAEAWVEAALGRKEKIMGFGHRVYKTDDPRAVILRRLSREVGEQAGDLHWYEMLQVIERVVKREKGLYPNVDLYSGSVYYQMGIPIDLFTPVFAIARIAGWTAHVLEQYGNNRLIRPRAEYTGPTHLTFVPMEAR
jgi:citrate synthase